jgi:hypothetical protein
LLFSLSRKYLHNVQSLKTILQRFNAFIGTASDWWRGNKSYEFIMGTTSCPKGFYDDTEKFSFFI